MKITEHFDILTKGPLSLSAKCKRAYADVEKAIHKTDWPPELTGST